MPAPTATEEFTRRIHEDWLPAYCSDSFRSYSVAGFKTASIRITEIDAADCLRAIDHEVVKDEGGGRYVAARSAAREVMFWEGLKAANPRPITLWIEPVITMAAAARLHLDLGWPKEQIGLQSKAWGFDFVVYDSTESNRTHIVGEVKKTERELIKLVAELGALSQYAINFDTEQLDISQNTRKKWTELLISKPQFLWAVGPDKSGFVYSLSYPNKDSAILTEIDIAALICANAA